MRFQHLVEPCETMNGNVAVLYANDEKMISVLVKALKLTNIDILFMIPKTLRKSFVLLI